VCTALRRYASIEWMVEATESGSLLTTGADGDGSCASRRRSRVGKHGRRDCESDSPRTLSGTSQPQRERGVHGSDSASNAIEARTPKGPMMLRPSHAAGALKRSAFTRHSASRRLAREASRSHLRKEHPIGRNRTSGGRPRRTSRCEQRITPPATLLPRGVRRRGAPLARDEPIRLRTEAAPHSLPNSKQGPYDPLPLDRLDMLARS
jgi:hypothetical protein